MLHRQQIFRMRRNVTQLGLVTAWGLALCTGFGVLFHYGFTPGESAAAPQAWPDRASVPVDPSRCTLLLFAHPRCPCTRASLGELSRLMSHCEGRLRTYVIFLSPTKKAEWSETDLVQAARAIRGVQLVFDEAGREARLFGAATSGQVLLYDPAGRLLFSGGITAARGHSGDNPGASAVLALINHEPGTNVRTPVFGCALNANASFSREHASCQ